MTKKYTRTYEVEFDDKRDAGYFCLWLEENNFDYLYEKTIITPDNKDNYDKTINVIIRFSATDNKDHKPKILKWYLDETNLKYSYSVDYSV